MKKTLSAVLLVCLSFQGANLLASDLRGQMSLLKVKPTDTSGRGVLVYSLDQCLAYAFKNQDSLKNSALDVKIATETVRETVGRGLPNVSLSASGLRNVILAKSLLPGDFFGKPGTFVPVTFGVPWQASYTAQATQLIFDASYLVGLKAAKVVRDLGTKSYTRSKIQVSVQVTKAFYNVLAAQERIKLTETSIARISKNLSDTRALNKSGFAEKIDAQRIEVQYNNAATDRQQSINGLLIALYTLKFQMGMPLENNLNVSGSVSDVNLTPLADTTSLPYLNRIEYSLLETQVEGERLRWRNNKAALLPKLSAVGSYGKQWYSTSFGHIFDQGFPNSILGLNFTWNVFDGSQTIHRINESRYSYEKAKNNLDNLQKGLQFQVVTSRITYMNNLAAVENQKRNRELAQQVYNTAKIKYTEGIGSSLELTDAEIALRESETNYITALINVLVSKVDLDQATGSIKI